MANAKYAQVPSMAGSGQLNWRTDRIRALLMKDATFSASDQRVSEAGGSQVAVSTVEGRYMGEAGEAMGQPAIFPKVPKNQPYQVLLVKDVADPDPMLIAFYDVDLADGPLQMTNNGSLILRPSTVPGTDPPTTGMWFRL
jgi:hypothetical protein